MIKVRGWLYAWIALAQLAGGCGKGHSYVGNKHDVPAVSQEYDALCGTTRRLAKEGRYEEALRLMRPYADLGLPSAQFDTALGMILRGDTNSNKEIVTWVRKAASQGYPQALGFLAVAYRQGDYGLPMNRVMSEMWEDAERDPAVIPKCLSYERRVLAGDVKR
jgi:TPR repeat protein